MAATFKISSTNSDGNLYGPSITSKVMGEGLTADETDYSVGVNAGSTRIAFEARTNSDHIANTTWASGTWTIAFEVTTANMNLTCDYGAVDKIASDGTYQTTLASNTSVNANLGTLGIVSFNLTQASNASALTTDRALAAVRFVNGSSMNLNSCNIKINQSILAPLTVLGGPPPPSYSNRLLLTMGCG